MPGLRRLRFYGHKSLKVKSFNINFTVLKADGVKAQATKLSSSSTGAELDNDLLLSCHLGSLVYLKRQYTFVEALVKLPRLAVLTQVGPGSVHIH